MPSQQVNQPPKQIKELFFESFKQHFKAQQTTLTERQRVRLGGAVEDVKRALIWLAKASNETLRDNSKPNETIIL